MCLNPQLRFNPRCLPALKHCRERYLCGTSVPSDYPIQDFKGLYNIYYSESLFKSISNFINYVVSSSYIISEHGLKISVYMSIPCNKCIECRKNYVNQISLRALIEASTSDYVAFFTLTYDDYHLPEHGLYKPHVQSAFKILRNHIKRYINPDCVFTSLYVGEYGTNPSKSLRPHYHGLLFFRNCKHSDLLTINQMFYSKAYSFFYKSHPRLSHWWQYGQRFDFQLSRNGNVPRLVRYVTKYIGKQFSNDCSFLKTLELRYNSKGSWFNYPFVQLPHSHGLGHLSIDYFKDYILRSNSNQIVIPFKNGNTYSCRCPSSILDRIYPALSSIQSVSNFDIQRFVILYETLVDRVSRIPESCLSASSLCSFTFKLRSRLNRLESHLNKVKYRYRYQISQPLKFKQLFDIERLYYHANRISIKSLFDWVFDVYQNLIYPNSFDFDFIISYLCSRDKFKQSLQPYLYDLELIDNCKTSSLIKFKYNINNMSDFYD